MAELEAKLPARIGMQQIVSLAVDDVDVAAAARRRPDRREQRVEIDVDHHDAEGLSVRRLQRRRDAQHGHVRLRDCPVVLVEVDRRDIDLAGRQRDRLREVFAHGAPLQLGVGHAPHAAAGAGAVDAQDLAPAVGDADHAELEVGRLGAKLGHETIGQAVAPLRFAAAAGRIDAARDARANQPFERDRRAESDDVGARAARIGLQLRRQGARMRPDAVDLAGQDGGLDAAIGQHADGRHRQQHQNDHGGGETCRKIHALFRAVWIGFDC